MTILYRLETMKRQLDILKSKMENHPLISSAVMDMELRYNVYHATFYSPEDALKTIDTLTQLQWLAAKDFVLEIAHDRKKENFIGLIDNIYFIKNNEGIWTVVPGGAREIALKAQGCLGLVAPGSIIDLIQVSVQPVLNAYRNRSSEDGADGSTSQKMSDLDCNSSHSPRKG